MLSLIDVIDEVTNVLFVLPENGISVYLLFHLIVEIFLQNFAFSLS